MSKKHQLRPRRAAALFAVVIAQMSATRSLCATDDHWASPSAGTWDVDANWDQGVDPVTTDFNAIIDATGQSYEVDIVDDFSVAGITVNSSDATVEHSGGFVSTPTLEIDAGTYQLDGGTLSGATITTPNNSASSTPGQFLIGPNGGTLDNVTLATDVADDGYDGLTITNGLTLSNATLRVNVGKLSFADSTNPSVQGNGTINLAGADTYITSNGTITIGSGVNVVGSAAGTAYLGFYDNSEIVNQGTITAGTGNTLVIKSGTLTNYGMLEAQPGGTLSIQCSVPSGGLGSFEADTGAGNVDGIVELGTGGILLNDNYSLQLEDVLTLNGGDIQGGTISTFNHGQLSIGPRGGTLDGVTLESFVSSDEGGTLQISNGLTLSDATLEIGSGSLSFGYGTAQSIDGDGTIQLNGSTAALSVNQGTLTIGQDATVSNSGYGTAVIQANGSQLINYGTLSASYYYSTLDIYAASLINYGTVSATNGGLLVINVGSFTNSGTLSADSGGTISIQTTLTPSALGYFTTDSGAGTVELGPNGVLDNSGTSTTLGDILSLNGGTITGGTLLAGPSGGLVLETSGTLDNLTLGTDVSVASGGALYSTGTLNLAGSTIAVTDGRIDFGSGLSGSVTGTGTIQLTGGSGELFVSQGTLSIGSGISVEGSGSGTIHLGNYGDSVLVNSGTISATGGATVDIDAGTFTNNGTLSAEANSTILIDSTLTANGLGNFTTNANGSAGAGTVALGASGVLMNAGYNTVLSDTLTLDGGTISGGTISTAMNSASGNGHLAVGTGGTLDGVTLATDLAIASGGDLHIANDLALSGSTVSLTSGKLDFGTGTTQHVAGTGTVELDSSNGVISLNQSTLTIDAGINVIGVSSGTVHLGGTASGAGNGTLINDGVITANAGNTLDIDAGTFMNQGTLSAQPGGTISIESTVPAGDLGNYTTNTTSNGAGIVELGPQGTLLLNPNRPTSLPDTLTLNGGTISGGTLSASGGQVVIGTGGTFNNVTLATNVNVASGPLHITNNLAFSGATLSVSGSGSVDLGTGTTQSISGNGTINVAGGNSLILNMDTLTTGSGVSIMGDGTGTTYVGNVGNSTLVNNGTLIAGPSNRLYINVGTLTNNGTLLASSGGTVSIQCTITGGLGTIDTSQGGIVELGANGVLLNTDAHGNPVNTILTGALTLNGGKISGGTISSATSAGATTAGQLVLGTGGTLDGVNLAANTNDTSGILYLTGGLTLTNSTLTESNTAEIFLGSNFSPPFLPQTIGGNGTINVAAGNGIYLNDASITLGSGVTIVGSGNGYSGLYGGSYRYDVLTNKGTLTATSGNTLSISATTLINSGLISAQSGGTVSINAKLTGGLGSFTTNGNAGTVQIGGGGNLINTGMTTTLTDTLTLNGGTITGGTIALGTNGNLVVNPTGNGTLDGVTLASDVSLGQGQVLYIADGLTLTNATLTATDVDDIAIRILNGDQTIGGNGSVALGGNAYLIGYSGNLTIGSGVTISGSGGIGDTTLTNNGKIVANGEIFIGNGDSNGSNFINDGMIDAQPSSTVEITCTVPAGGLGNFTTNGGKGIVAIGRGGTLSNAGTNTTLADIFTLDGGSIIGGTISATGAGSLAGGIFDSTLSGITLAANFAIPNNIHITNGFTLLGHTISLTNGSLNADSTGSFALSGTSVAMQSGPSTATFAGGLVLAPLAGDNASYTIAAGSLNVQNGFIVAAAGIGSFTATGGSTTRVTGPLCVGCNGDLTHGNGSGSAHFLAGSKSFIDTLLLGSTVGGTGDAIVDGGSVTISGGAHLNDLTVNSGTVTVLDQTPPVGEDPELNRAIVGGYLTNGGLYVNGGTVTSPNIKFGITSGYTGIFDQTAGTTDVGILALGDDASLNSGAGTGIGTISGGSVNGNTLLLGSTVGGGGDLTVSGTGVLTLAGGAHLNDLNVAGGSVTVQDQNPPAGEDPELNRAIVGGYLTNGALDVSGGTVTAPYIKLGVTKTFTGTLNQTGGTIKVTTLSVGADTSSSNGQGMGIANFTGGSATIGNLIVGSTAGGVGSVNISSNASLSLTSAVTFTAGTINFENASITLPSGTTTVGNGTLSANLHLHNATVSGSGTTLAIAANATLDGGGSVMPGENTGTTVFSQTNLSLSPNALLHIALGGDPTKSGNVGTTSDQITQSGGVFTVGGAMLQILPLGNTVIGEPYPIVVANSGGSINYSQVFASLTTDPQAAAPAMYTVSYSSSEIDVTFSVVPEPTTPAAVLAIGCILGRRRRKSCQKQSRSTTLRARLKQKLEIR